MHRKWIRKCNEKYTTSIKYFSKRKLTDDLDETEDVGVEGDFVGDFVGTDVIGASDGNNEGLAEGYLETDGACVNVGADVPL